MLYFDKEKTEVIFFDIEYYVPPKDRTIIGPSLVASPFKENQFILGGVFTKYNPFKMKNTDYVHFWIWKDIDEKRVLEKIYRYIQSSWEQLTKYKHTLLEQWEEGLICNMQWQADLMFCGIGISQFDIPMLYFRSQHHQIASAEELFNCYFKARALDLNTITIPFFNKDEIMYPKPTNAIYSRFGIKEKKESGRNVWTMFEQKKYHEIENRTQTEVRDCLDIYKRISYKIYSEERKRLEKKEKRKQMV